MNEFNCGGIKVYAWGLLTAPTTNDIPIVAIFFAHGRKHYYPLCENLQKKSKEKHIIVFAFNQRNHEDRLKEELQNEDWSGGNVNHQFDMWNIQYGTAKDISYLIDVLPHSLGIRFSDFGVFGVSLGGHATMLAMAHEPQIKVGVSIIGCGDYLTLLTNRAKKTNHDFPKDDLQHSLLLDRLLLSDPVNLADRFIGRPLLMLNGLKDSLVPVSSNERFVEAMKGNGLFFMEIDEEAKHEVSDWMVEKMEAFFSKWLVD